jgi:hypothetical protein
MKRIWILGLVLALVLTAIGAPVRGRTTRYGPQPKDSPKSALPTWIAVRRLPRMG